MLFKTIELTAKTQVLIKKKIIIIIIFCLKHTHTQFKNNDKILNQQKS